MQNDPYISAGLQVWAPDEITSSISSLHSPLPNVSAIWVFFPPEVEAAAWSTLLPALGQADAFSWAATMRPQRTDRPELAKRSAEKLSHRSMERITTQRFPMFPYMESACDRRRISSETGRNFITGLSTRGSGFALALGSEETESSEWLKASVIMESHFSLHRDFGNTVELEEIRRRMVSLYVRSSTTVGLLPLIPLNKHPEAGFVLFCHSDQYSEILTTVSRTCHTLEGGPARERIIQFIDRGGDLAYL